MDDSTQHQLLRSHVINPDNHGAYVTIASAMMLTSMTLFCLFRLATRWPLNRLFASDDSAVTAATVVGLAQAGVIINAVNIGLGQHANKISPEHLERTQKQMYAGDILYIITLCLAKLANCLLITRLTRNTGHVVASHIISAFNLLWGLVSVLVISIGCTSSAKPWDHAQGACSTWAGEWIGITVVGIIIEILLLVLPIYLVWSIQMPFSTKMIVVVAFSFRIPVIPLAILRLVAITPVLTSRDYTFDIVPAAVYTQVEMHLSVIASTIPCMRPFLNAFNTGYMTTTLENCDPLQTHPSSNKGSGRHSFSDPGSYAMQSQMRSKRRSKDVNLESLGPLRPDVVPNASNAHVETGMKRQSSGNNSREVHFADSSSFTSDASDKMIIRKTVAYSVDHNRSSNGSSLMPV